MSAESTRASRQRPPRAPILPDADDRSGLAALWIRTSRGVRRLDTASLEAVEAADDYVLLHGAHRSDLHRGRLRDLAAMLPSEEWARIHRSALVRLSAVIQLEGPARRARLTLVSGRRLAVSRAHLPELRARLRLEKASAAAS